MTPSIHIQDLFSPLNALLTLVTAVTVAVVALAQAKRVSRERLDQTIAEYDRINKALQQADEVRQRAMVDKEDKILRFSHRIGVVEGQNRWLTQSLLLEQQYCQMVVAELRRMGGSVPPRPPVDEETG